MAETPEQHLLYALLVEDDQLQAATVAAALATAGFSATVSHTGTHAIDSLTHKPHHLVIVDLHLPDVQGPELIRILRSTPHGITAKIVAVTASDNSDELSHAFRAGADDVYQKSIGHDVLVAKFESLAFKFKAEASVGMRLSKLETGLEENTKLLREMRDRMDKSAEAVTIISDFVETAKFANKVIGYTAAFGRFLRQFWWLWALPAAVTAFIKTGIWNFPTR